MRKTHLDCECSETDEEVVTDILAEKREPCSNEWVIWMDLIVVAVTNNCEMAKTVSLSSTDIMPYRETNKVQGT